MERLIDRMFYIASPYTHKDKKVQHKRYIEITKIGAKLFKKKVGSFFLPITQSYHVARVGNVKGRWCDWRRIDIPALRRCDELWVVMLDGWKQSVGVRAEIREARKLKIPIKYIKPEEI